MATTSANRRAARWFVTKLLVYTNLSNYDSSANSSASAESSSSNLCIVSPFGLRGVPQPSFTLRHPVSRYFLAFHGLAQENVRPIADFHSRQSQRVRGRRSFLFGGRHSTGPMKVVA